MASRDINDLDHRLKGLCIEFLLRCRAAGLNGNDGNALVFIDCTFRSSAEQDMLYAQGRTTPGPIVTHAQGGQSAHNYGTVANPSARAFDIAIHDEDGLLLDWNDKDPNWKLAHDIGRDLGLVLGADWPEPKTDGPHFELPDWNTV